MKRIESAERVSFRDVSDNYVFQRSRLAYYSAAQIVSGDVLEIGTGSGYGVSIIAPHVKSLTTVDKFNNGLDLSAYPNVEFHQMNIPPLSCFASNSFDYVISFQVIEHIRNDFQFVQEIFRVLKPGGKVIITTPNKPMSLTRNPWHVREYTIDELTNLLGSCFHTVDAQGVFGNESIMTYYNNNKRSVEAITRLDFLNLQYIMPRWILKVPYDFLNRLNRRRLLIDNRTLTAGITMNDYFLAKADANCFDLFFIATK